MSKTLRNILISVGVLVVLLIVIPFLIPVNQFRPTIEEILAPVRSEFANSGLTDDEIMNLGRNELAALRNEKKAKSA